MTNCTYKIYPAIGIARVGNSQEFYIGPEEAEGMPIDPATGQPATSEAIFRDENGAMRRQAARFHIYRCNKDTGTVECVTLNSPEVESIEWTVHVANKKASWYTFETNLGQNGYGPDHPLRNATITDPAQRQKDLIIDAGPRKIAGTNVSGAKYQFDKNAAGSYPATFPPEETKPYSIKTLGEIQTDECGRLLFIGGHGHSGNIENTVIRNYANNDNWWDDTSDGPVSAQIKLKGIATPITVEPAWVITAPPAYVPEIANLVTLYDTIFDAAVRKMNLRPDMFANQTWNRGEAGYKPEYETEIKPIIQRAAKYPWVVAIPLKAHRFDYDMLGRTDACFNSMRQYILDVLRPPSEVNTIVTQTNAATMMPYLAGDNAFMPNALTSKYLSLTDTQYFLLQQWADGYFVNDKHQQRIPNMGEQLTQAILENCVGGGFSPGIEMTWISRVPEIYAEPFRIKVRQDVPVPLSLGLDYATGLEPGDITRYMALPWQADFNECSAQKVGNRVLWWWPPQRPLFVYLPMKSTGENNEQTTHDPAEILRNSKQVPWIGIDFDQNAANYVSFSHNIEMVEHWHQLGFVYNIGSDESPHFVEVQRTLPRSEADDTTIDP